MEEASVVKGWRWTISHLHVRSMRACGVMILATASTCMHRCMDTLGFEPRAFRMRSGCDTTTPCAHGDATAAGGTDAHSLLLTV